MHHRVPPDKENQDPKFMIKKKEETEVKQMSKRISDLSNNLKDRLLGKSFDPPPELEERIILNLTVSRTIKTNSQEKEN